MNIGMLTSTVQHVVEVRSSWTVIEGDVYPARSPHVMPRRSRTVSAKIARELRGMDAAKAEIAHRIRSRGKR